ncbi:MAG: hypothetical protein OXP09_18005 [Gammaproteobacteria bacterium]|nr:hypothetical protein [Gammaproteobacteria bacterium]
MRPSPREGPPPVRLCEHNFAKEPGSTWLIDNPLGGAMFFCTGGIGIGEVG